MRKIVIIALLVSINCAFSQADEGMWPISRINSSLMTRMKALGLQLDTAQIYSGTTNSLKDAVVMFNGGCTGEFVSANGLLFTNHHCALEEVQKLSTDKRNYLRDGYWAASPGEEIRVQGLTVNRLVKVIDVSREVKEQLKTKAYRRVRGELEKQYSDSLGCCTANLDAFSDGSFTVSIYQEFKDVRLVGIPPESIGNFGGDADNFEWPRHSADFAIFRVYAGADNQPASYSPGNKPYKSKTFLPISQAGIQENDFVMSLGFPYTTSRYLSSFQLKEDLEVKSKATSIAKGKYVEVLEKEMEKDESVRLKYSSKYFSAANSGKLASGTWRQTYLSPVFGKKQKEEAELDHWINADTARQNKYGGCLATLDKYYKLRHDAKYAHALLSNALFTDASVFGIRARQIVSKLEENNRKGADEAILNFRKWYASFSPNYDLSTDREIVRAMLKLVNRELPKKDLPACFGIIDEKYNGSIDAYVNEMYAKTIFATPEGINTFLHTPQLSCKDDPLYIYGTEVYNKLVEIKKTFIEYDKAIAAANRLYREAISKKDTDAMPYPDANFTMRLTFGTVKGADPRDGIRYKSFTTVQGIIEKGDSSKYNFYLWPRLKELIANKDFGKYAPDGVLHTCFLSNTDITGGNSGSPVLNARGELVGLAFDGVWESLAGNYIFEPERNRSINVDIRYVLFIIDKYANATYILNELLANKQK